MPEITFVSVPYLLNSHVFDFWINGYTEKETAESLTVDCVCRPKEHEKRWLVNEIENCQSYQFQLSEAIEQFNYFKSMKSFLLNPKLLKTEPFIPFDIDNCNEMLEKFYSFNPDIIKEILLLKATLKHKKEIAEKLSQKPRICKRHIEIVKSMTKAVTENNDLSIKDTLMVNFILDEKLAVQYSSIVFLYKNKFELNNKKLAHLDFDNYIEATQLILSQWGPDQNFPGNPNSSNSSISSIFNYEINYFFMKSLLASHNYTLDIFNQYKSDIYNELHATQLKISDIALKKDIKKLWNNLAKLAVIASKDIKNLFISLFKLIINPFKASGQKIEDIPLFINCYIQFIDLYLIKSTQSEQKEWATNYKLFIQTVESLIGHLL